MLNLPAYSRYVTSRHRHTSSAASFPGRPLDPNSSILTIFYDLIQRPLREIRPPADGSVYLIVIDAFEEVIKEDTKALREVCSSACRLQDNACSLPPSLPPPIPTAAGRLACPHSTSALGAHCVHDTHG